MSEEKEVQPFKPIVEIDKFGRLKLRNDVTGEYLDTSHLVADGFQLNLPEPGRGRPTIQLEFIIDGFEIAVSDGMSRDDTVPREFLIEKLQEAEDD